MLSCEARVRIAHPALGAALRCEFLCKIDAGYLLYQKIPRVNGGFKMKFFKKMGCRKL